MFSHIVVGSNDLEVSRKFYDATFAAIGVGPGTIDAKGRLVYSKDGMRLLITRPIDGKPATFANGGTIGLKMDSPEMVTAWHDAGVANGGTSIEDPPGIRDSAAGRLFLAYLRDPFGNKLCGRCALE
ncbi:MAG: glyoxalase [Proteobacteria bacterium]|nr:MAG: glyoxalase [Pseudomonadota bacterium]